MRRYWLVLCVTLMAAAAWAIPHVTGNAVSASDASAKVMWAGPHGSIYIANTGSTDEVYVRVWQGCEVETTITTTTAGAMAVRAGKSVTLYYDPLFECGGGYNGFSYIMATGKTTTFDYVAK